MEKPSAISLYGETFTTTNVLSVNGEMFNLYGEMFNLYGEMFHHYFVWRALVCMDH